MDSECMVRDDQEVTEEWIVRVEGREYGPANIDILREWKAEGRVLPANEARRVDAQLWTLAAEIPGLFDVATLATASAVALPRSPSVEEGPPSLPSRTFGQILSETFRIYARGFFQFLLLTLLVVLPWVCGQLAAAWAQSGRASDTDLRVVAAGGFAFLMFIVSMTMWPVYVAGIQIFTVEIVAGRRPGFFAGLNDAVRFWPRVAALGIFVRVVFALLILLALFIAAMLVSTTGTTSAVVVLSVAFLSLGLLILQVWMFGRFFINVLFWQQFAVLENAGFLESLRESRNLAHSGRDLPWFQRPMWRGVFIASLWFAFVLTIVLISEWTTMQHYFNEVMTTQDPQLLVQKLTEAQHARGFDFLAFALGLLQKILQPLIGIAFVILYLESRRGRWRSR
jgi:hypothetical protein